MNYCDPEDEFDATWTYMIDTYNLCGHKWLNGMYKIRKKWATAFSNGRFSAGLLATSRSEVTNMVLKKAGNKMCSLYEFVMNYTKILNKWREKEKFEDTRCRHGKPAQILKNHPLLIHAADVYTISIYKLFEIEMVNSLNCKSVQPPSCFGNDWNLIEFRVKSHDENSRVRQVVFNKQNHEIKCSCSKFETMGILCKHVLTVFNSFDVTVLPNCYILKRWMKNIKTIVNNDFKESGGGGYKSEMVFVNQIMRSMYDLTQLSKSHEDARKSLYTLVDTATGEISNLLQNLSVDDETPCDDIPSDGHIDEVFIRNPLTAKAKGVTNANITRHWDNKSKKGKRKGKEKAEIPNAKGGKRKGQSSKDDTTAREINNIPSQQHLNLTFSQNPFLPPQHFVQHSNQMEGNTNLYTSGEMNLFPYQFQGPNSSQEGNTNLYTSGEMNLFPYHFQSPHS
ncbi:protein FAR1-RELATED SEQUENCE 5-like isoform X2 [Primulina eburnea]|uniref:protein FAR1-RELATED SEQUENCE 5-like isoform X2 n=1 Tax=Primulina eburnea TaxID=1245227 RepID=UPI003C6CC38E